MASKMIGALFLVLLLALTHSDGQVLPPPCCRFNCCNGDRECCGPGDAPLIAAEGPATAGALPRKVSAGASDLGVRHMFSKVIFGQAN
jgi:hypothetical protein